MPFIAQGKTNLKYILIVVVLAVIVGGGILAYQFLLAPKEEPKIPEVKMPEEVPADETADWKTYSNDEYRYEVQYPKGWLVKDSAPFGKNHIRFEELGDNNRTVDIRVYNNSGGLSLNQWFDSSIAAHCGVEKRESALVADVSGIEAIYTCGEFGARGIFLSKETQIYNIDFLLGGAEFLVNDNEGIYNQILSTFKFIEEDETVNWKDFKNAEVIAKENKIDENKTDIFIKNLDTNEEKFYITLSDVNIRHYHNSEFHNGNLYIIKQIGYEGYPDKEWSDELWKYDNQKRASKIYSIQGIDFRVAPNEEYIALRIQEELSPGKYSDRLVFIDNQSRVINEFTVDQLSSEWEEEVVNLMINPIIWSDDSNEFWGSSSQTYVQDTFFKLKVSSWETTLYNIKNRMPEFRHREYDLNPNTGRVVYSNYPVFFEVYGYQEWEAKQEKVTLFVYNFNTDQKEIIATSIAKSFQPKWLNDNAIEYNNPSGDDRIIYNIK